MRVIISVSDKRGIVDFAIGLYQIGTTIYSTGGTKKALAEAGLPVHSVEQITGFPEILDGRVKTLHPAVHGGILARRDVPNHINELQKSGMAPIDMVVVNLYPFRETVASGDASLEDALENIDIGGPTMIRAAAKNFPFVLVVVDPDDYLPVLERLRSGPIDLEERKRLAQKAFQHVAMYDTAIAEYLRPADEIFPADMTIALKKHQDLSYGENPHQRAAFYTLERVGRGPSGMASAAQLWGKELSYNNILDLSAAMAAASDFSPPTIAIIKHNNPCGLSCHQDLAEAYRRALSGDPVSAFGGIVASNRPIDEETAREIDKTHFDGIIAPGYDDKALELLKRKRDLRLIQAQSPSGGAPALDLRGVGDGLLVQTADATAADMALKPVTQRQPTTEERADLLFAWRVVKHVKSNAIVLARDATLLGMGAGQPSRVDSVEIALKKAGERSRGSVLASDAFFPFPDGVELAAKGGITAIIQPGGSVRDEEAIRVANEHDIAMVFTGMRHFRH